MQTWKKIKNSAGKRGSTKIRARTTTKKTKTTSSNTNACCVYNMPRRVLRWLCVQQPRLARELAHSPSTHAQQVKNKKQAVILSVIRRNMCLSSLLPPSDVAIFSPYMRGTHA